MLSSSSSKLFVVFQHEHHTSLLGACTISPFRTRCRMGFSAPGRKVPATPATASLSLVFGLVMALSLAGVVTAVDLTPAATSDWYLGGGSRRRNGGSVGRQRSTRRYGLLEFRTEGGGAGGPIPQ